MTPDSLLDRMVGVYQEARALRSDDERAAEEDRWLDERLSDVSGNASLFFNEAYHSFPLARLAKKIVRRLMWPILNEQVIFNRAVRDVTFVLRRRDALRAEKHHDALRRIADLEKKVAALSARLDALPPELVAAAASVPTASANGSAAGI